MFDNVKYKTLKSNTMLTISSIALSPLFLDVNY